LKRREFITLVGEAAAWSRAARAQQPQRLRRVGLLIAFPKDLEFQGLVKAFKQTLDAQGWVDGKNVHFDERWAEAGANRIPSFAADIVGATPDVILASSTPALVALRQQTRTIPLVFVNVSDPVDGGFVDSMARPGGNVTGFTSFEYSIGGKWLELLKEAAPSLKRVLVVLNQENYTSRALLHTITALAPSIGVQLSTGRVRSSAEIKATIETFGQLSNGAVIILPDPLMTADRERIAALAISHRLPTIHPFRFFAVGGCLMSYGTDNLDLYRRAASYVDRILKGADAAEMPVQNPTKYSLAINLKTAKALGIEVSPTLLARADEVIE
jgi:putative tryptophan/tyrosine transport system substrate-binding protein